MSWQDKSVRCTTQDYEQFRRDWEAIKTGKDRREDAVVKKLQFEEKWVGCCQECARPIPTTKQFCPWCKPSRF